MAKHVYVADFWAWIPGRIEPPAWSLEVAADGAQEAMDMAMAIARKEGHKDLTYMALRRKGTGK